MSSGTVSRSGNEVAKEADLEVHFQNLCSRRVDVEVTSGHRSVVEKLEDVGTVVCSSNEAHRRVFLAY